jgi:hypothetical protein
MSPLQNIAICLMLACAGCCPSKQVATAVHEPGYAPAYPAYDALSLERMQAARELYHAMPPGQ